MTRVLPQQSPVVELANVSHTFPNGVTALRNLDLKVEAGEFLSLLGPSGCGKSTVLRLIAGLLTPTGGSIRRASNTSAQGIGFVFQEPTLMPWATVAANVALPLKLSGVEIAERRRRVDEALAQVGLSGFVDVYPRELSGGMRMRVSIARALITRPQLLLMDEPFAALDEITRFKLNDDLLALWQSLQMTVVFVTHSVFESAYLSTRIAVMTPRPGRIAAELDLDAAYPRGSQYRTSAEYAAVCRRASQALSAAMADVAA
jgi:NitT/TauT family transport system ATP-binding protein